jgi:VIT1/CCC1 family predicted Fe2+/Mn2+ transporter
MAERATQAPDYLSKRWLGEHLSEERRSADLLSEVREAIFGAQDGVTSILTVVITVATATSQQYAVLVAGIAAALAEVLSMGAGEYMSSKSQREIFLAQIEKERQEVADRPGESEAEVAYMLEQEGLPEAAAKRAAAEIASEPNVLLKTMVEKELGITVEEGHSPLQGAMVLALTFAVASLVPISPFFFFPVSTALWIAVIFSAVVMFFLGVAKSRLTGRNPVRSGLEIVGLVLAATVGGWVFGSLLPHALGFAGVGS